METPTELAVEGRADRQDVVNALLDAALNAAVAMDQTRHLAELVPPGEEQAMADLADTVAAFTAMRNGFMRAADAICARDLR